MSHWECEGALDKGGGSAEGTGERVGPLSGRLELRKVMLAQMSSAVGKRALVTEERQE